MTLHEVLFRSMNSSTTQRNDIGLT